MSSGYDDRDDDRDDDRRPRRRDDRDDRRGGVVEEARRQVQAPAVVLLIAGVLALLAALLFVPAALDMDTALARVAEQWENDPNLTPKQKQDLLQGLADSKDTVKTLLPVMVVLWGVTGLVTVVGAIRLLTLSGRGLAVAGSVLSMLPFVNGCCCVLGLPVGIWVLVILSRPDVGAGFAAAARGRPADGYAD